MRKWINYEKRDLSINLNRKQLHELQTKDSEKFANKLSNIRSHNPHIVTIATELRPNFHQCIFEMKLCSVSFKIAQKDRKKERKESPTPHNNYSNNKQKKPTVMLCFLVSIISEQKTHTHKFKSKWIANKKREKKPERTEDNVFRCFFFVCTY